MRVRYQHEIVGFNFRMTDIHASIGLAQLPKLPGYNARRRAIAARYDRELHGVITPQVSPGVTHVYHQYTIRVNRRDEFVEQLKERGVGSGDLLPDPGPSAEAVPGARLWRPALPGLRAPLGRGPLDPGPSVADR